MKSSYCTMMLSQPYQAMTSFTLWEKLFTGQSCDTGVISYCMYSWALNLWNFIYGWKFRNISAKAGLEFHKTIQESPVGPMRLLCFTAVENLVGLMLCVFTNSLRIRIMFLENFHTLIGDSITVWIVSAWNCLSRSEIYSEISYH